MIETWVTGIGVISCLGEGPAAHWQGLHAPPPAPDTESFAPCIVHRLPPLDFDLQIPKKSDQRQMQTWQRIGTYAAGLALESAQAKRDAALLSRMDLIVAAGGGERDETVDGTLLSGLRQAADRGAFLNERLMNDLRPTNFLTLLSNLLAGNISIVHGVTGSSRTFMGEEAAGVDAVRVAQARIAAGQSSIALVGGACNSERRDLLLLYAAGGFALKDRFAAVWDRAGSGGVALGSLGAFLVLESKEHAIARNVRPFARLSTVFSERSTRQPGSVGTSLAGLWDRIAKQPQPGHAAVISGATGAQPGTNEEQAWLRTLAGIPARAAGTHIGHGCESQFVMNVALASLSLSHGTLFPPTAKADVETEMSAALRQVVVTAVGHWRGEGMALVEAVI